jgi:hypothetical protein
MSTAPGGHVPPIATGHDSIRAVLSEGEAWVDADALNQYGAEFFSKMGGGAIKSENIHPADGGLRNSIVKLSAYVPVSAELLVEYTTPPSEEDVARWRTEEQTRHAREDARHAQLLAAGNLR